MSSKDIPLDVKSAEDHLLKFLAVEGVTGRKRPSPPQSPTS